MSKKVYRLSFSRYSQEGFTLIELLIVMTIIAVLSALSFFAISGAREAARDARRKADLEQIASALEMYKADCGYYPTTLPNVGSSLTTPITCTGTSNVVLQSMPGDPTSSVRYSYNRLSATSFELCAHLEDRNALPVSCVNTCNPSPCKYKITNP